MLQNLTAQDAPAHSRHNTPLTNTPSALPALLVSPSTGMAAGLPKFVTVNLSDLDKAFEAGSTIDLQSVQDKKLLNISGRDTKLPLKVREACCEAPRCAVLCFAGSWCNPCPWLQ